MSYLLDTNIISETTKLSPNKNLMLWLNKVPQEQFYVSVLTIGELKQGIEKLPQSKKKNELLKWLEFSFEPWLGKNLLNIDKAVAERWGYINATNKKTLSTIDCLIGATALTHNLKLVTRNEKDFSIEGLEVINPFL
jgi:predicted nucleic acid-binding protein